TETQPVFDIIAERAARLTGATYGWVFRVDDGLIHVAASYGVNQRGLEAARKVFPMRPGGGSATAKAVRDRTVVNIADVLVHDDPEYSTKHVAVSAGYRSVLAVPMLREGEIFGAIAVSRVQAGAFASKEVDL